jgi:hypothetical protein
MFEQSLQPEEWKDQQAIDGRSVDEIQGRRWAAGIVALNALLGLGLAAVANLPMPLLHVVISLVVAWYLYKLRPRAENLTLGLALLYSTALPMFIFLRHPLADALIQCIAIWGVSVALLLLLIGEPSLLRRLVALAVFGVFACGTYALMLVGLLLEDS